MLYSQSLTDIRVRSDESGKGEDCYLPYCCQPKLGPLEKRRCFSRKVKLHVDYSVVFTYKRAVIAFQFYASVVVAYSLLDLCSPCRFDTQARILRGRPDIIVCFVRFTSSHR